MTTGQMGRTAAVTRTSLADIGAWKYVTALAGRATIFKSILCLVEVEGGMSRSVGTITAV
jgi:hypothetical protein